MEPSDAAGPSPIAATVPEASAAPGDAIGGARLRAGRAARLVGVLLGLSVGLVGLSYGASRVRYHGAVLGGVQVGDVALSGLDREEARAALNGVAERLKARRLLLEVDGQLTELDAAALGVEPDLERTLDAALAAGRGGAFAGFRWWLAGLSQGHRVDFLGEINEEAARAALTQAASESIRRPPSDGALEVKDGALTLTPPTTGQVLEQEPTLTALRRALLDPRRAVVRATLAERSSQVTVEAAEAALTRARRMVARPIRLSHQGEDTEVTFSASELTTALRSRPEGTGLTLYFDADAVEEKLRPLRGQLEDPPKNARFVATRDGVKIEPSSHGTLLSASEVASELLKAASAGAGEGHLPITRSAPPAFSTQDAEALGIRQQVASFTTYHACCEPRVQNIHLIAELLDETVVLPGERFSVNEFIGPRTQGKGFVEAPTISRGEMVDSYGGGISQFATTLFVALLDGGYEIIQRQPHSYYFTRYPEGHEATLSFPVPDLIFRNDTQAGLWLKIEKGPTFIRVRVFGDTGGRKVRRSVSRRFDIVKPDVEYEVDDDLDPEKEKVLYGGMDGWSVMATRTITEPDGKKREESRKVVYRPRTRIVRVHSCKVPKDFPGYTGKPCPEPELDAGAPADEGASPEPGAGGPPDPLGAED